MKWLIFALGTVACWGLYGPILHVGNMAMKDAVNGRYKAFLFVGFAYFLVAVLAPLGMLMVNGAKMEFPSDGWKWSLFAGTLGALGAFFLLVALGAAGREGVVAVMAVVFAGAPIVAACYTLVAHPPEGGVKWQFLMGIALAAAGGCMVSFYRPEAPAPKKAVAAAESAEVPPSTTSPAPDVKP